MDRLHWCLSDVAELYGPIGYGEFDPENIRGQGPVTFYPDEDPNAENPQYDIEVPDQPAQSPVPDGPTESQSPQSSGSNFSRNELVPLRNWSQYSPRALPQIERPATKPSFSKTPWSKGSPSMAPQLESAAQNQGEITGLPSSIPKPNSTGDPYSPRNGPHVPSEQINNKTPGTQLGLPESSPVEDLDGGLSGGQFTPNKRPSKNLPKIKTADQTGGPTVRISDQSKTRAKKISNPFYR